MTNITCFLQRFEPTDNETDATPILTRLRYVKPIEAIVRREGSRMVDNADFSFTSLSNIEIGDYIGYIQDYISTDDLIGLWNFWNCCRDESGNQFNSLNEYLEAYSSTVTFNYQAVDSRIKNRLGAYLNTYSVGSTLKFPNKVDDTSKSLCDFYNDFTITMSVVFKDLVQSVVRRVVFDKYNTSTSTGIILYLESVSDTQHRFVLKVNSLAEQNSGNYNNTDLNDKLTHIVFGGAAESADKKCFLNINGIEAITRTTFTGDATNTSDIYLGKEYNESSSGLIEPDGVSSFGLHVYLFQMRIYIRALSEDEIDMINAVIIPFMTLKFYGQVWKKEDKGNMQKVYCNGLGDIILKSRVDSTLLSDTIANFRTKNIYGHHLNGSSKFGLRTNEIMNDILTKINTLYFKDQTQRIIISSGTTSGGSLVNYVLGDKSYPAYNANAENFYRLKGQFHADGSFLDIINIISVLDDVTFTFTPLGVIHLVKNNAIPEVRRTLSTDQFKILEGGYDNTNISNQITTIGKEEVYSTSYNTEGYHYFNVEEEISTFNAVAENVSVYESKSDGSGENDYTSSMICEVTPNIIDIQRPIFNDISTMVFGNTGLRFYIVNKLSGSIAQYTLSTAWDLSTAVLIDTVSLNATSTVFDENALSIAWKSSGLRLFSLSRDRKIYMSIVSTAWDIKTLTNSGDSTFSTNTDLTTQLTPTNADIDEPISFAFKSDGTKLYVIDRSGVIYQFTISAWNIGSLTYDGKYSTGKGGACSLLFKSDGSKLWILCDDYQGNGTIGQTRGVYPFTLGTNWSVLGTVTAITAANYTFDSIPSSILFNETTISASTLYTKLLVMGSNSNQVTSYTTAASGVLTSTLVINNIFNNLFSTTKNAEIVKPFKIHSTETLYNSDGNNDKAFFNTTSNILKIKPNNTYYGTLSYNYNYTRLSDILNTSITNTTDQIIQTTQDDTAINKNGLQSKKFIIPYLDIGSDLIRFNTKFISRNKGDPLPRRIKIQTVGLIDDLIENVKVGVFYATKSIGTDLDPEMYIIKKIEYYYPIMKTVMEIGDFIYDSFDLEKVTTENIRGLQQSIVK